MRSVARAGLGAAISFATALPAAASGGGESHGGIGDLIYPAINFLILVGALVYFARKPIQAFFAERRETIRGDVEGAAALHKQAEERYAKWQRRLAELEGELAQIHTTARERAERERDQILSDARATAERIRRDASSAIDQELRRAKGRLREESAQLAVELAAGILRENVNDGDRARLIDEFIERVERPADRAGNGR